MAYEFKAIAPVLLVRDVLASCEFWEGKLGFMANRYGEPTNFAIVHRGEVRIMLAQVGHGAQFTPNWRVVDKTNDAYIWVSGVDELYEELCANGTPIDYTLYTTPWGTREFGIQDLDDHDITFGELMS